MPAVAAPGARTAAAALAVFVGMGAVLAAASLALHALRVEALSRQVGGGWGGVSILLLGPMATKRVVPACTVVPSGSVAAADTPKMVLGSPCLAPAGGT